MSKNNSVVAKFVLLAHGSVDDATRGKDILTRTEPVNLEHHR